MKNLFIFLLGSILSLSSLEMVAQQKTNSNKEKLEKPYKPADDAQASINALLVKAKRENKNIILQAGGNWCIWCLRFNDYITKTKEIKNVIDANFLYYHLNFSPDNKNEAVFAKYAPDGKSLGYPFFIVLDKNDNVLKLQESGSLESGKGYDKLKVLNFLNTWKVK